MLRLPAPPIPHAVLAELPFERYRVEVGPERWRMHVMERGRGLLVVMLHGNPTWGFLYRKVAARLDPDRFRVILPDLIGLGYSDKPRSATAHTLAHHAAWFGDLLDHLRNAGVERFVFVGQDWGGPIGFAALHARPERCAGLVVLNTAIGPPRPGFRPTAFHRFARVPLLSDAVFRLGQFPQAFMATAQGDRRLPLSAVRAYVGPLLDPRDNVAPLALARMVPDSQDHPSIPALTTSQSFVQSFRGPAAIVWGTRDPILGRMVGWVEKNLPQARVTKTQAGHFLQEEVPDEIALAIEGVTRDVQAAR